MKNGKRRGQKKQKRKGAYDKSGGITYDTAAFAFRTKDILKIRSRPRLEPGSDYHYLCFVDKKDAEQTLGRIIPIERQTDSYHEYSCLSSEQSAFC